ncbi:DUF3253 domain-containing protein [Roseomonas marmotae]|uniref:DUF3253 domain-containing protein n=1 Tax=Roseomonas marmotae TaxID=2768161 RepID=A0ABS3KK73_9PROT|nr:DUF3253 domain-containing protein [Roseomonas marmotae]MBO1076731.1 DUF3253 domain-containing protein [Roseomonas marmotae]QTI77975.1 DUF3253 domain-containing protein [Roseomonas marmotae]
MTTPSNADLAAEILRLTAAAPPGKSIAPSDVARAFSPPGTPLSDESWRPLLPRLRKVALALQQEGRIEILRKGKPVPPEEVRGVIRLRAGTAEPPPEA